MNKEVDACLYTYSQADYGKELSVMHQVIRGLRHEHTGCSFISSQYEDIHLYGVDH